jgi:hypothetical protein
MQLSTANVDDMHKVKVEILSSIQFDYEMDILLKD